MNKQKAVKPNQGPIDVAAIRAAAKKFVDDGAVASGYKGNREEIIQMLNEALATELVCVMRYKRHYFTATGLNNEPIKAEFLEHAQQEAEHADRIAERIVQLNGEPDFNPVGILERSHADYDTSTDLKAMVRANLVAERVAIESYRQMIALIGDKDPTTRRMLESILSVEEEHADELKDMLE